MPCSPQSAQVTLSHRLSNTTPLTQLNWSTHCNPQPHTHSPSSTNRCRCITNILHTLTCTRRSRTIFPILRCTTGTTIIPHTRHHPLSCIPRPQITRNVFHPILTTLARPSCSVPLLLYFPPRPPAIRIPQPKLRLPPATKIKNHTIPRPPYMSGRLAPHRLLSLRRTNLICTRSKRDWTRGPQ